MSLPKPKVSFPVNLAVAVLRAAWEDAQRRGLNDDNLTEQTWYQAARWLTRPSEDLRFWLGIAGLNESAFLRATRQALDERMNPLPRPQQAA